MANYARFTANSKIPAVGGLGEYSVSVTTPTVTVSAGNTATYTADVSVPNGALSDWTIYDSSAGQSYDPNISLGAARHYIGDNTQEAYIVQRVGANTYRLTVAFSVLTGSRQFTGRTITAVGRLYNVP